MTFVVHLWACSETEELFQYSLGDKLLANCSNPMFGQGKVLCCVLLCVLVVL
jgi:hypothetical protein